MVTRFTGKVAFDPSGIYQGGTTVPVGAAGPILYVSKHIDAVAFLTLFSAPVELIPAPGPNKIALILGATLRYNGGSAPVPSLDSPVGIGTPDGGLIWTFTNNFILNDNCVAGGSAIDGVLFQDKAVNHPLYVLNGSTNIGIWGAINESSINAGGSGYAVGDTGTVAYNSQLNSTSQDATYLINSIGEGGAVTGYTLSNPGTAYRTEPGCDTQTGGAQPGSGTGFTLDVVVNTPQTGSIIIDAIYVVVDASV